MKNNFDELTKSLAQAVTRRGTFKKFGVGLAGMALACFGLAITAEAAPKTACLNAGQPCTSNGECCSGACYNDGSGAVCLCTTHADCKHMKPGWRVCCFGYCNPCQFA
jgi:hypothetical protein